MWPFWKKRPEVPFGVWTRGWAEGGGRLVAYRARTGLDWVVGHPDYAHLLSISTPVRAPDGDGLPGPEEAEDLEDIHVVLQAGLQVDDRCVLALVIATGGMYEWVFYTRKPEPPVKRIGWIRRRFKIQPLQVTVRQDPEWSLYRRYVP